MNQHEQLQAQDDYEISLIDIFLFLKASGGNIVKSTLVSLLAGGVYYFSVPKTYEASATIEMARVAGEPVESPVVLIEKMKLPLYFSPATLQACGSDSGLNSRAKFDDKFKPNINKSVPMVSFVTVAPSSQEAKACLNAAIADVSSKQDAIANPLIEMKKQKLNQLSEQLKTAEEIGKSLTSPKIDRTLTDTQVTVNHLLVTLRKLNINEINDLQSEISSLKFDLIELKTRPTTLLNPVYSTEVSVNKRPLFTLGLCLALGMFLGLLVTGVQRVVPEIRRQMQEAESRAR
jgi:LPS O-antigen subunit length determinant protein (WzzB/FepE family)